MDRAVLYMKLYTFGMPFMNCTIAEIISCEILYLIFDYPHKHYTFKYFEV